MTRPATKTKALVAVFSFLAFAGATLSQGLSNLHRITEGNGDDTGNINSLTHGRVRSNMYVIDQAAPGAADTNPGTEEQPFKTIQHAADLAKPGDTVYVMTGTYDERIKVEAGGTAGKPVAFETVVREHGIDLAGKRDAKIERITVVDTLRAGASNP